MNPQRLHVPMVILASAISTLQAAAFEPVHGACTISASEHHLGMFRVRVESDACREHEHCDSSFDEESLDRLTGISLGDLANDGAGLTATLTAEAGTFRCSGSVQGGALVGESIFTPDAAFAARMEQMGISGLDSEKLRTYAFVNVESQWAHSLEQTRISGLTADNLIPLRIFHVDREYVLSLTGLGYPLPSADQLVALKVQGVNAEEVRQIRALGYQPTFDELIQIRIFRVTPEFIRNMEARGLKNLTIAKLVQIRIFNLDE